MDGFADRRGDLVVVDGGHVGGVEDGSDGDVGTIAFAVFDLSSDVRALGHFGG